LANYKDCIPGLPVVITRPLEKVKVGTIGVIASCSPFREVLMVTIPGKKKKIAVLPDEIEIIPSEG